jgi:hypothetical protein
LRRNVLRIDLVKLIATLPNKRVLLTTMALLKRSTAVSAFQLAVAAAVTHCFLFALIAAPTVIFPDKSFVAMAVAALVFHYASFSVSLQGARSRLARFVVATVGGLLAGALAVWVADWFVPGGLAGQFSNASAHLAAATVFGGVPGAVVAAALTWRRQV